MRVRVAECAAERKGREDDVRRVDDHIEATFPIRYIGVAPRQTRQVLEKIGLLLHDPTPDAKTKKLPKYSGGYQVCWRSSGDYRILYTFEHPHIGLLSLRRDDSTYHDIAPEHLGGLDVDLTPPVAQWSPRPAPPETVPAPVAPLAERPLPELVTAALLRNLQIPTGFQQPLRAVASEEELLGIRWQDADLQAEVPLLRIMRVVVCLRSSARRVAIDQAAAQLLREHWVRQFERKLRQGAA